MGRKNDFTPRWLQRDANKLCAIFPIWFAYSLDNREVPLMRKICCIALDLRKKLDQHNGHDFIRYCMGEIQLD